MTQEQEEETLFQKVVKLKHAHDKLFVIMEELEDLIKMRYDGPFMGEEIHGLTSAYQEYKRWESEQR
jgi:hypothetical protein